MTFRIRNLGVLAYTMGFTLWNYKGGSAALRDICSPGFFDDAIDMMATGDMIHVSATDGGATLYITGVSGHVATAVMASTAAVAQVAA